MKYLSAFFLIALTIISSTSYADYDAALEAEEAAARQKAAAEAARRKAESDAMLAAAKDKAYRKYLGAEADGLSGAELERAYNAKVARDQEEGLKRQAEAMALFKEGQQKIEANREQNDEAMKNMTGKTVTELQNMSDAELEKFAADMEKKFGAQYGEGN